MADPMANQNGVPAIEILDLRKSFGRQQVLRGISLKVPHGETLVILGRSGMGKSVLLKIVIGLQKPDSGGVEVDGEEITKLSVNRLNQLRKRIGFLFQYSALFDSLTVAENVAFPLRRHVKMPEEDLKQRVYELLSRVDVQDASSKLPAEISGGMRKRVALARALALKPEILLCDEPTAGLDPITAGEIDALIRSMQQKYQMTSIVVTHDLQSARTISDRVALLHEGDIVFLGTFEELVKSPNDLVRDFVRPVLREGR